MYPNAEEACKNSKRSKLNSLLELVERRAKIGEETLILNYPIGYDQTRRGDRIHFTSKYPPISRMGSTIHIDFFKNKTIILELKRLGYKVERKIEPKAVIDVKVRTEKVTKKYLFFFSKVVEKRIVENIPKVLNEITYRISWCCKGGKI